MYQKRVRLLGGIVLLMLAVIGGGIYARHQQKKAEYAYELLKVKSALEQIIQYSDACIGMAAAEELNEEHAGLVNAVMVLDRSVSRIALLCGREGALSSDILKLADHLNGAYPDLQEQDRLAWLEQIKGAAQTFLLTLEQTENMAVNDFVIAVRDFSESLPTYVVESG